MTNSKQKRTRPSRSLSTTITTTFLLLLLIVLLIVGNLTLFFNIQSQRQSVTNQLEVSARYAADEVGGFINEHLNIMTTTVALTRPYELTATEQTQVMQNLLVKNLFIRQLALYDSSNKYTSMASRVQSSTSQKITEIVTDSVFSQTQQGQNFVGRIYSDIRTQERLILMAVPDVDVLGEFRGTLVAEFNLVSVFTSVNRLKIGDTGYAYVVDKKGTLVAYKDSDRVLKGENIGNIKLVQTFLQSPSTTGPDNVTTYTGVNGTTVLGTYIPLGTPNWAVVTELPWQEAYRNTINLVAVSLGIILVMAALTAYVSSLISRRLATPVIELTNTASAIAAGDLNQRAPIKGGLEIETLAGAFNKMTDQIQDLVGGLEERVSERTQALEKRSIELQNTAQIVREISNLLDTDTLMDRVTHLVRERFGYYHTGIFLVDDNEEYAVLKAAGGDAGQLMLANNHKLRIGETGIVGFVAKTGEARIALDVGTDAVHFQNPILPYTRSEMALPLKVANRVIGVLDIQSEKTNAFDQGNISVMQILTDQISINFERSRLLQDLQQNAAALDATLQENTSRTWQGFMEEHRGYLGYQFDGVTIRSLPKSAISETRNDGNTLAVPIQLRGQTLGTLNLQFQGTEVPQETLRVVEEAANRLALALENARLVQDTQRLALRERQINVISAQAQRSTDLQTLLQSTIKELGNSLGVPRTFIQVGVMSSGQKREQ